MKRLKTPLSVRGDSAYCPLALSLDSYWNCLTNCHHCYLRNMNAVWGEDLRPIDLDIFERKLRNGLKNKNPKSILAHCLARKKTIRWGNKTDPFQQAERDHRVAPAMFKILHELNWSYVIETMHTDVMMDYREALFEGARLGITTVMPVVSPGLDRDWEVLERKRTNPPHQRLRHVAQLHRRGVNCGVNGEPFIPGYHTVADFEEAVKAVKATGVNRYNTYNFHFTPFVAKRLHAIGIDVERIWVANRDENWKPILQKLLDIAKKYDIILGCPDFVNTGPHWRERANTCCGVDVPNPTTFNTHYWKAGIQDGEDPDALLLFTWDGSSSEADAEAIVKGKKSDFYTLKDAGVL